MRPRRLLMMRVIGRGGIVRPATTKAPGSRVDARPWNFDGDRHKLRWSQRHFGSGSPSYSTRCWPSKVPK